MSGTVFHFWICWLFGAQCNVDMTLGPFTLPSAMSISGGQVLSFG